MTRLGHPPALGMGQQTRGVCSFIRVALTLEAHTGVIQ